MNPIYTTPWEVSSLRKIAKRQLPCFGISGIILKFFGTLRMIYSRIKSNQTCRTRFEVGEAGVGGLLGDRIAL